MRTLLLAAVAYAAVGASALAAPLLKLSADQVSYSVGATAHLAATALIIPENPREGFHIAATLNGVSIPVTQTGNGIGVSQPVLSASGTYTWTVQLYLEDIAFARQLTSAIQSWTLQDIQINDELGQTTDPTQVASLQAQLAQNQTMITEAQNELTDIRRPFGPSQNLVFSAQ